MSAIFQRPLCEMGAAYDYAYRPAIGDPDPGSGGACDERPHRVELWAAGATPSPGSSDWRAFSLCPEHETQLRHHDHRLAGASRFRTAPGAPPTGAGPAGTSP